MTFCKHEYGKWSEAFDNSSNQFDLCRQSKVCTKCGKIVMRRIWWSDWCTARAVNDALKEGK